MNDYFDFSIYIDADSAHIEHWYIERFLSILNMAKQDSNSYYAQYTTLPQDEAVALPAMFGKQLI